MAITKHTVCLLALFALLSLASCAHQDQFRMKRQAEQDTTLIDDVEPDVTDDETLGFIKAEKNKNWTTCDWRAVPKFTCHDCNTRLICKPIGGILKFCGDAATPHCRNGFCSAVPSDECVSEEEPEEE